MHPFDDDDDDENQHLLGTYHTPATLDTLHKMFHFRPHPSEHSPMQVVYLLTKRMKIKEPILEITVKLVVRLGVLRQHFPRNLYEELYWNSLLELGRPSRGPKPRFEVEGPVGSHSIETIFDENCGSLWITVSIRGLLLYPTQSQNSRAERGHKEPAFGGQTNGLKTST